MSHINSRELSCIWCAACSSPDSKHTIHACYVICMEILYVNDLFQIGKFPEPRCSTGKTGIRIHRTIEHYLSDISSITIPSTIVRIWEWAKIHTVSECFLIIVIECQYCVITVKRRIRLRASCSIRKVPRIVHTTINVCIAIVYVLCIVGCTCTTNERATAIEHVGARDT